jgi:preprotein translocase subunit YajC
MGLSSMPNVLFLVFAQTTVAGTAPAPAPPGLVEQLYTFVPIIGVGLLFYFVFWLPMRKERKQRESLLNLMKKNDEVLLSSGIYGTIIGIAEDKDEITVKISDNTRIRVIKSAIGRNLTNEEALKAQQPQKDATPPKKEG